MREPARTPGSSDDRKSATRQRQRPSAREIQLVRLALGLMVLQAIADAFLFPQPGTAAGDHVASGLVPVALYGALAAGYPRLRPWWQSALAGSFGVLALLGGVAVSARHIAVDKLAAADVFGILAGLAGIALLGCACVAARRAWRPRSQDRSLARRLARRAALTVAVCAGALFVVVPLGIAILATHKARSPVKVMDLGRPHVDVTLRTSDGLRLRGSYVPSRNRAAVIAFPGRSGPLRQARMLIRHGYGVLLIDRRGEGDSHGRYNAYGWRGERDIDAALTFLAQRPDVDPARIGGIGLSVGGELLLQSAAGDERLRAVVSEGAGVRSIRDHLAVDNRGLLSWITPLLAQTAATAVLSDSAPPPALSDLVSRIAPRAVFFVYAGHGQGGEELNTDYFAAARRPKQSWKIPDAGHTGGLSARPAQYERRVVGFFDRYLLDRVSRCRWTGTRTDDCVTR